MYVITFYSFKGGVGRTMALVNVAAELVRRGRTVLVVDFDLEAPGLETYKRLRPEQPHPGIVEYITEFRQTQAVPDLREYIYEAKPIGKRGGRLWVMPAGRRDRAYRNALTDLDWKRLYQDEGGFLLFEDTKKGWEKELNPDYVLIDSRTGDTDVLGICTRQLPDTVVLMFMPNEQNLAGLKNVVRDIRREETEGLKKSIRLHFVAANVPRLDDEERILRDRLSVFRKELEFETLDGIIDRYDSLLLLDQPVFVVQRPRTRLAKQYRRLVWTLQFRQLHEEFSAFANRPVAEVPEFREIQTNSVLCGDLLLELVNENLDQETKINNLTVLLLSQRQWARVIDTLKKIHPLRHPHSNALALFHQAIAHWGLGSEMPEDLCRQIVGGHALAGRDDKASEWQALALVYWRLGERARARGCIYHALGLIFADAMPELSYWRCLEASPEEFCEDCRQIDRLIEGEPLQPLFLAGPSRPEPGEPNMA